MLDRTEKRKVAAYIGQIFETVRNYQVPIVVLDTDSPLESICRVFETINSTGTRLTTFDLAVAKFYPEPDLRTLLETSRSKHSTFQSFGLEGERVLQVIALGDATRRERYPEASRSVILQLDPTLISNEWSSAVTALHGAYTWAQENAGARPDLVPNHGILVALAAFLGLVDAEAKTTKTPIPERWGIIKRWYFTKILQQGVRQASNYRIGRDYQQLVLWSRGGALPDFETVYMTPDEIVDLNQTDVRYRALQCVMCLGVREDLITAQPLALQSMEEHHIFPSALGRSGQIHKKRADSICNKIFVSKDTNRKLSDTHPAVYMKELLATSYQHGTTKALSARLESILFPPDVDSIEYYVARFRQLAIQ